MAGIIVLLLVLHSHFYHNIHLFVLQLVHQDLQALRVWQVILDLLGKLEQGLLDLLVLLALLVILDQLVILDPLVILALLVILDPQVILDLLV
jgi:hypothetical protein